METSSSKELILSRIRKALAIPAAVPFNKQETEGPLFPEPTDDLSVLFATEFTRLLGRFSYCSGEEELVRQITELLHEKDWKNIYCREKPFISLFNGWGHDLSSGSGSLADCDASITGCEALVARTGSLVLSAAQPEGRTTSVYAPVHICIAFTSQLVFDVKDAFLLLKKKYGTKLPSLMTFATGPSRTADIEKTLVVGVHGPREVYCFLVDD